MNEAKNKNEKIPVIFLVGMGHSGSTLIDMIMDSHSQIVGVGELSHFKKMLLKGSFCSCGEKIKNCRFWQAVLSLFPDIPDLRTRRKKKDFLLNTNNFLHKGKKVDLSEYLNVNEKLYESILENSNKKVVFDSSKNPDRAELLLKSDKLDVTLVHLVRDGRGVTYSHTKRNRKPWKYIKEWATKNLKTEFVKKRNNIKTIFINYEDFASDPQKHLEKILFQIGLSFEPQMLEFNSVMHHQLAGNRKFRFHRRHEEVKPDVRWKKELNFKTKALFTLSFGWLNWYYKK